MKTKLLVPLGAALLFVTAGPVFGTGAFVPGQKLDSGLGNLPHYSKWSDPSGRQPTGHRVLGESLDSGLGELPHYAKWVDPSGRDPLGRNGTQVATLKN